MLTFFMCADLVLQLACLVLVAANTTTTHFEGEAP